MKYKKGSYVVTIPLGTVEVKKRFLDTEKDSYFYECMATCGGLFLLPARLIKREATEKEVIDFCHKNNKHKTTT